MKSKTLDKIQNVLCWFMVLTYPVLLAVVLFVAYMFIMLLSSLAVYPM